MTSRWQKPDYRIGNTNSSTYDHINHNAASPDAGNVYYKKEEADDVRNKMAADQFPVSDDHDDYNVGHPPQTYRDDPRYGSAHRRSRAHNIDNSLGLDDHGSEHSYHPYDNYSNSNNGGHRDMGHRGLVDPRTGNHNTSHRPYGVGQSTLKNGGALLFIRFPAGSGPGRTDNIGVACQAFLRSKTSDLGGKFLGIAKSVYDFGYHQSSHRDALGVYHFPSQKKAKLFFQYDMTIRQPDFPPPYGHAEIWTVSNAYLPDDLQDYNTFLMSEIVLHNGRDRREFFENFQKPFERYLSQSDVMPFVVCSYGSSDRECLRRHAYPHESIVTCHLFRGQNHLRWLTDQEMYLKFRSLHNQMADERCQVFTIERDLCP